MSHNPYTPPAAPVADPVGTDVDPEGSRDVLKTNMLLWISLGLGVVNYVLDVSRLAAQASLMIALIALAFGVGIGILMNWWFTHKLKAGRNWMRILLTVFGILAVVVPLVFWDFYKAALTAQYASSTMKAVVGALQYSSWVVAIVFLHTKRSRDWFAAMNARR